MSSLKGNAIVGQSGGCTAVINQSLAGVIEAARASKEIKNLWGSYHGVTGILNKDLTDLFRQPRALVRDACRLPSAALGSTRYRLKKDQEYEVVEKFKKWNIRYAFLVGGNDTAQTAFRISRASKSLHYDLRIIHIPKTIDNDLVETDHCPGYGSTARFAAIATQEMGLDTKAMRYTDPVKIIELMGRNSGWIVAASALLKKHKMDPPHLICVPEAPFRKDLFISNVEKTLERIGYCIVVISETIRDEKGRRIGERKEGILKDAFGHPYVEGAANHLARLIERKLKVRARFNKPGTIQRMSMAYGSPVDQQEAFKSGIHAVRWAVKGNSDVMVAFKRRKEKKYRIEYQPVPLEKIPGRERYLPASFLNKEKTGVTESFIRYALPLMGGSVPAFPSLAIKRPKL